MTDTYVYSDGSNVLINKMGIRDRAALQRAEYRLAAANAPIALMYADNARSLNEVVWRGVHKRLFADLYGWAGKFRTVSLSKGRTLFAPPAALHGWADERVLPAFRRAARTATSDIEFATALAACWGELNFLHPFREGNGRSTQIFVTALARRYGRSIDWRRVEYRAEIMAAKAAEHQDYAPYAAIILAALTAGDRGEPLRSFWPDRDGEIGRLRAGRGAAKKRPRSTR